MGYTMKIIGHSELAPSPSAIGVNLDVLSGAHAAPASIAGWGSHSVVFEDSNRRAQAPQVALGSGDNWTHVPHSPDFNGQLTSILPMFCVSDLFVSVVLNYVDVMEAGAPVGHFRDLKVYKNGYKPTSGLLNKLQAKRNGKEKVKDLFEACKFRYGKTDNKVGLGEYPSVEAYARACAAIGFVELGLGKYVDFRGREDLTPLQYQSTIVLERDIRFIIEHFTHAQAQTLLLYLRQKVLDEYKPVIDEEGILTFTGYQNTTSVQAAWLKVHTAVGSPNGNNAIDYLLKHLVWLKYMTNVEIRDVIVGDKTVKVQVPREDFKWPVVCHAFTDHDVTIGTESEKKSADDVAKDIFGTQVTVEKPDNTFDPEDGTDVTGEDIDSGTYDVDRVGANQFNVLIETDPNLSPDDGSESDVVDGRESDRSGVSENPFNQNRIVVEKLTRPVYPSAIKDLVEEKDANRGLYITAAISQEDKPVSLVENQTVHDWAATVKKKTEKVGSNKVKIPTWSKLEKKDLDKAWQASWKPLLSWLQDLKIADPEAIQTQEGVEYVVLTSLPEGIPVPGCLLQDVFTNFAGTALGSSQSLTIPLPITLDDIKRALKLNMCVAGAWSGSYSMEGSEFASYVKDVYDRCWRKIKANQEFKDEFEDAGTSHNYIIAAIIALCVIGCLVAFACSRSADEDTKGKMLDNELKQAQIDSLKQGQSLSVGGRTAMNNQNQGVTL